MGTWVGTGAGCARDAPPSAFETSPLTTATDGGGTDGVSVSDTGQGPNASDAADETGPGAESDTGFKFDLAPDTDGQGEGGNLPGECGCGEDEWSYIWVANSSQSTVSKINTRTQIEEGRYYTRPDANGNPSRTSVSLGGRAAAVANRNGGVAKIWARQQFCTDTNGNGMIDTSSGAGDVLAWGSDECVAWHRDFPSYDAQRPVAWAGDVNPDSCDDELLWTSGCGGFGSGIDVHVLNGATGETVDMVNIPELFCGGFGGYGGAMDPDGNFWIAMNGTGSYGLARVSPDMQVSLWAYPRDLSGYGMTVDNKGRPWVSSYGDVGVGRFDPDTETWSTAGTFRSQGGVQQGEDLRIWVATEDPDGVVSLDPESLDLLDTLSVPGGTVKGISLDVDGYLWAVSGAAYQYDVRSLAEVGAYSGLSGPYTYSDMTGWGLQNANCNPPEG